MGLEVKFDFIVIRYFETDVVLAAVGLLELLCHIEQKLLSMFLSRKDLLILQKKDFYHPKS